MNSISCRAKEDQRPRKFPATLDRPIDGAIREATSSGCTRSGSRGGDDAMGQGAAPRVEHSLISFFVPRLWGCLDFYFLARFPVTIGRLSKGKTHALTRIPDVLVVQYESMYGVP